MSFLKQCTEQGLIDEAAFHKLSTFADLILEWNSRINLTGFKTREPMEEILLGEPIHALRYLRLDSEDLLDFGSGAGVPGFVWLICRPRLSLTSVESRQKKVAFQKEVARTLGLAPQIVAGRFPEAVAGRQFDVVATRAIRFSPAVWNDAAALVRPGGCLVRFTPAQERSPDWTSFPLDARSALAVRQF
jgi:16S rRNA (guanine527-N7)-methyltransferase